MQIKDYVNPQNSRTIYKCVTAPFFSSWYGILIVIFLPLIIGVGVAFLIKYIAEYLQRKKDEKKNEKKEGKEFSLNTKYETVNTPIQEKGNKIMPLNSDDMANGNVAFIRVEKPPSIQSKTSTNDNKEVAKHEAPTVKQNNFFDLEENTEKEIKVISKVMDKSEQSIGEIIIDNDLEGERVYKDEFLDL